ncbi:MAG: glycosyltransferase family 4 protein [Bacteroidetes bacterium]|nr:glycosyltransferase family 4 protein [Bacteroidota bacterium]
MKILFLYTEIAEYFLACCNKLAAHGEVHIVRWPVNKEAPFRFTFDSNLKVYNKNDYTPDTLKNLVDSINPNLIVCSGWIDKDYLRITRTYSGKIPTVMTCDTHWRGDLKQQLATFLGRIYLTRIFSHAWVPGQIQREYVLRLGFKPDRIETGFYSCDLDYFESVYRQQFPAKKQAFPRRFVFVGRYYEFKGVKELWQAFIELQQETPNNWELWCLGVGDIEPVKHEKIRHFGFVQPGDLHEITAQTGVFILPSRFEPWGVVAHEFAASGFPLVLSDSVGAAEQFLTDGENGYRFDSGQVNSLKDAMKRIMNLTDDALLLMAEKSHKKAQQITPQTWVGNVLHILEKHA